MTRRSTGPTVSAARRGETWAISALYTTHQPALSRWARAMAGRSAAADADDLTQTVWIDALRNLKRYQGSDDDFRAWLFTIARRRAVDRWRAATRRPTTTSDPAGMEVGPRAPIAASAEEVAQARTDGSIAARLVVDLLPRDQAEAILLRVVGDFTVEDVAHIMKISPGNVRVLQHRGLKRLGQLLSTPALEDSSATEA